ncbi:MAG: RsbRD N-terminal domain-containing protein [Nitrospirota bacterium]|nr:RsbRD N-terminal domain-containing protein [Nitrospirota bacterium]MDH5767402.1 RsbRD N-terminal domain-containing protein [Nitrospirota bacterium]
MSLEELLLEKKPIIVKKWFHLILETYPADASQFLKKQKNQFANPVGHTISHGIKDLFEELLKGMNPDKISPLLDTIIRIRAVQDFSPSKAVAFIFLLKKVVREELKREIKEHQLSDELVKFDSMIDDLALLAFDIYMQCREKIYELKTNELKNMTFGLLKRANLIYEIQEEESDFKSSNIINLK